ncbi:hypothetical protein KBD69_01715 [Candidatus Woesebacteria bacterium]|nr:hypothetical protein [Candidatus Woesebacteria bacterium]
MPKSVYFIGIKGVGMTSLALSMQDSGWHVSGCDTTEIFITDDVLNKRQINISLLTDPIPPCDLIIHSAAYPVPTTNTPTKTLAQALADFVSSRRVIAVAGVGGKTTTSAMLAALFHDAGRDVGYYVGTSTIAGLGGPGHSGTDPYFVIEADEYAISKTDPRPKFALLSPEIVITTNIIHDHPDIYPSEGDTLKAFTDLIARIPATGTWIYNDSDPLTQQILNNLNPVCKLLPFNLNLSPLSLSVFGDQNQLDAQAAVSAAVAAGVSTEQARQSIMAYRGAGRRQESHGEVAGRHLYDDYGHHPAEIGVTVNSFKQKFPNSRVLLIFESHTYTRTESLLPEFAAAISTADLAFIMPIFESAREKGQPHQVTPESFAKLIPGATALTWDNAADIVWQASREGDIILTMGAGFVYKLHDQFKKL